MPQLLSPDAARRVGLAAQGLPGRRTRQVGRPQALRAVTRLAQIQLDSVSVLARVPPRTDASSPHGLT